MNLSEVAVELLDLNGWQRWSGDAGCASRIEGRWLHTGCGIALARGTTKGLLDFWYRVEVRSGGGNGLEYGTSPGAGLSDASSVVAVGGCLLAGHGGWMDRRRGWRRRWNMQGRYDCRSRCPGGTTQES